MLEFITDDNYEEVVDDLHEINKNLKECLDCGNEVVKGLYCRDCALIRNQKFTYQQPLHAKHYNKFKILKLIPHTEYTKGSILWSAYFSPARIGIWHLTPSNKRRFKYLTVSEVSDLLSENYIQKI